MGLEGKEMLSDSKQQQAGDQAEKLEALLAKVKTAPVPGSEYEAQQKEGIEKAAERREAQRGQGEQIPIPGEVEEEKEGGSDGVVSTPVPGTIEQSGEQAQIERIQKQAK